MAKEKHGRGKTAPAKDRSQERAEPVPVALPEPAPARAVAGADPPALAVVGIGASAGGLEAFKQFLTAMPADTNLAFVLIQHLDPTHESLTVELLARHTEMPILQVVDEMPVEPNHVYVIPPNKYLTISGKTLHLTEPVQRRGVRVPIDFFFRSLADDQREQAIGVILTGSGTDGTLGVREIKAGGGMIVVQKPETAQFDNMPRSAIATGIVDHVVPIEEMPDVLVGYVRHWYVNGAVAPPTVVEKTPDDLTTILSLLRARAKYDFSSYKKGTLTRRVQRRMGLNHIERMSEYAAVLRQNRDEIKALYKDLLIGVTNFFREPEAWEALEKLVITPLVERSKPALGVAGVDEDPDDTDSTPIRVWVPGCATGEEAYSLAILLTEKLQARDEAREIQIFASDIDQDALAFARAGIYPESIAADVTPERLRQFFIKGEHTYRVNKEIREAVVFAEQNLISDPPFSKLNLISCRNLLIYLEPEIQKKILSLFHFALRRGGYLFLGNSETISQQQDLFETVSRKWRLYRRIGPVRREKIEMLAGAAGTARPQAKAAAEPAEQRARHVTMLAQQLMLQRYAPACVLINRKAEVLYLHGPVDQYLQLPVGELGADLIAMAREGLRTRLRSAVHQAVRHDRRVQVGGVRVKRGQKYATVYLTVEPLQQPREAEHLLLVSFDEQGDERPVRVGASEPFQAVPSDVMEAAADYEAIVRQLEDELRTTREDLQSTIEELETSNEEFKAANEEVMSINEELQSANEELETSKEELQSLNEELQTVNSQLEQKLAELEATNNDLSNLLASTDVATIFLDRQFCLRRFTPATTRILRVLDTDVGRPISDLAQTFTDGDLIPDAERVLQFLGAIEKETQHVDGYWYVRRIVPYRTEDNRIEGVVVTFRDITRQRADERSLQAATEQLEQRVAERTAELESSNVALRESERRFRTLLESAPDAVVVVDDHGHITQINRRAEELFGYSEQEAAGLHVNALAPPDRADEFAHLLAPLRRGDLVRDFETVRLHKDGTPIDVALTVSSVAGNGFCSIIHDIRERKHLEQQLAELTDQERQRLGRELHDSLGQQISALGILVAALQEQLPSDVPGANLVVKLESALDQAKQQVRALVKGLFPVSVDAAGLRVALQELTEEIARSYQIACRFECPHEVSLRDNFAATQLFLIAREAALNAARHSRAAEIVIRLTDHDGIRVAVEDNGVGLPADVARSPGMGLRIMRHRCGLIHGMFRVRSSRDGGTVVACVLPEDER